MSVNPTDIILAVKNQVEQKENIPVDDQRLLFNNKPFPNNKTLEECGIPHESTLQLEPMEIVEPTDSIDQVKDKIEKKHGIPKQHQQPIFKGKPLTDGNKTLRDCGIKHHDTLELAPMQINVKRHRMENPFQ